MRQVRGRWAYLYRAVDKEGNTVNFRLSPKRDVAAGKAFFRKALRTHGRAPISITLDGYAASHRAVREMPSENRVWKHTKLRSSKYLNNLIEQDHRGIKSRTGSDSSASIMLPSPLPESNYYVVFTKANSPSDPYAPKTRLPPLSGTLSSRHRSIRLQTSSCPTEIICTRANGATVEQATAWSNGS